MVFSQGEPVPGNNCSSQAPDSGEKERVLEDQIVSNGMTKTGDLDDHDQDIGNFEKIALERTKNVTPFYQRVLAALIVEDEAEEFEENNGERDMSFQYNRDHSPNDTCLPVNVDDTNRVRTESNSESILGLQTQKQCAVNRFSCSGRTNLTRGTGIHSKLSNNDLLQGDHGFMHSNNGMFPSFSGYLVEGPLAEHTNASGISSIGCPYDQMSLEDKLFLELQSIGLYPETVVSI